MVKDEQLHMAVQFLARKFGDDMPDSLQMERKRLKGFFNRIYL